MKTCSLRYPVPHYLDRFVMDKKGLAKLTFSFCRYGLTGYRMIAPLWAGEQVGLVNLEQPSLMGRQPCPQFLRRRSSNFTWRSLGLAFTTTR
jgi:hypothetical protein